VKFLLYGVVALYLAFGAAAAIDPAAAARVIALVRHA